MAKRFRKLMAALVSASLLAGNVPVMANAANAETQAVESAADVQGTEGVAVSETFAEEESTAEALAGEEVEESEITLDGNGHTVSVDGDPVSLTLKEFELLKLFMDNLGSVFTREILLSEIWGRDYLGETRTVDVHIGTLRTKLSKAGDLIQTVRGVGYKMEEPHEQ